MKSVFFLISRLIFKIFYCFCTFENKHFINLGAYMSKKKWCYNVKLSAYYFCMETNITLNFSIRISLPLRKKVQKKHHVFCTTSSGHIKMLCLLQVIMFITKRMTLKDKKDLINSGPYSFLCRCHSSHVVLKDDNAKNN